MKLASVLILALALPACAAVSRDEGYGDSGRAESESSFGREGGYVAGAAVKGIERFDNGSKGVTSDDSDIGYAVRGGWRTSDGLAIEGSAERVTAYTIQSATARRNLDLSTLSVSGKFYLFDGRIQPYLTAGLGWAWVNVSGAGTGANDGFVRGGAGVDIYITRSVALFAEANYDYMTGDLKDLDHVNLMAGILIRF